MVARSALLRTESRGAHYRQDFPQPDREWLRNIYLEPCGGEMRFRFEPVRIYAFESLCRQSTTPLKPSPETFTGRRSKISPTTCAPRVRSGLAAEKKDGNLTAENVLFTILENIKAADEQDTLVCQDTGLPVYKVLVGSTAQPGHSGVEEARCARAASAPRRSIRCARTPCIR